MGGPQDERGLFKTAETGSAGQILDGDPSFVTFDQNIADNLGLNLKVVYAGSEAAELAALNTAYQKQGPILMYFWTPHWAQAKYELTMVKLPAVTPACTEAAANDVDEVRVRLPAGRPVQGVQRGPADEGAGGVRVPVRDEVHERRSERDRARHQRRDDDPTEAAQKWIDANPDVWQPWVDAGLAAQGRRRRSSERDASGAALRAAPASCRRGEPMTEHVRMSIDGAWTDAEDGAAFEAISPSTGEVVGTVAEGTRGDAGGRSRPRTGRRPRGRRCRRSTARPRWSASPR